MRSKDIEYKMKVLFAWKELAMEQGNDWASQTATKHILSLTKLLQGNRYSIHR